MSVDAEDHSSQHEQPDYNSDDSEHGFSQNSQYQDDPNEPLDYEDDYQSDDSTKIMQLLDQDRQCRIKELDAEMAGKMQELHQLMYDGGLGRTTKFIQDNFHVTKDSVAALVSRPGPTNPSGFRPVQGRVKKVSMVTSPELNKNYNHRPEFVLTEVSKSVEMIYKNVVEKRVSSSSEECIDISDETLGLIVDTKFEDVGELEHEHQMRQPET